jgi:hypothetical protein
LTELYCVVAVNAQPEIVVEPDKVARFAPTQPHSLSANTTYHCASLTYKKFQPEVGVVPLYIFVSTPPGSLGSDFIYAGVNAQTSLSSHVQYVPHADG